MKRAYRFGLALAVSGLAEMATAQQVQTPPATGSDALEEIVVTAQRREENLQHAAVAVTAITGADLENSGVIRQQDLTQLVPSLQVSTAARPLPAFLYAGCR